MQRSTAEGRGEASGAESAGKRGQGRGDRIGEGEVGVGWPRRGG